MEYQQQTFKDIKHDKNLISDIVSAYNHLKILKDRDGKNNKDLRGELADDFSVKRGTIDTVLNHAERELGMQINTEKIDYAGKLELVNKYNKRDRSVREIAKEKGISTSYAYKILRKLDGQEYKPSEGRMPNYDIKEGDVIQVDWRRKKNTEEIIDLVDRIDEPLLQSDDGKPIIDATYEQSGSESAEKSKLGIEVMTEKIDYIGKLGLVNEYNKGEKPVKQLAEDFNISKSSVYRILNELDGEEYIPADWRPLTFDKNDITEDGKIKVKRRREKIIDLVEITDEPGEKPYNIAAADDYANPVDEEKLAANAGVVEISPLRKALRTVLITGGIAVGIAAAALGYIGYDKIRNLEAKFEERQKAHIVFVDKYRNRVGSLNQKIKTFESKNAELQKIVDSCKVKREKAVAKEKIAFPDLNSIVDTLKQKGLPSSFNYRTRLWNAFTQYSKIHGEKYKGTTSQNRILNYNLKNKDKSSIENIIKECEEGKKVEEPLKPEEKPTIPPEVKEKPLTPVAKEVTPPPVVEEELCPQNAFKAMKKAVKKGNLIGYYTQDIQKKEAPPQIEEEAFP